MWCCSTSAEAANADEMARNFKNLPTVKEKDLPPLKNERGDFPGSVKHPGLVGHVWVKFPFIENPGSFGFDRKGRLYVAEANRFWLGVPDLRGANEMIRSVWSNCKDDGLDAGSGAGGLASQPADRALARRRRDAREHQHRPERHEGSHATTEPGRVLDAPEPEVIAGLKAEASRLCPGIASR